jgi:N-acetylmuramoyl-L-alanine amidase
MRITSAIFLLAAFTASAQPQPQSFIPGRTSGKLSMLAGNLGQDRLGGSKMGYIDSSVLLKILDSTNDLYHVQLSFAHRAYIKKMDVRKDSLTDVLLLITLIAC